MAKLCLRLSEENNVNKHIKYGIEIWLEDPSDEEVLAAYHILMEDFK